MGWYHIILMLKRLLDIAASLIALVVLFVPMLAIAVAIRLESPGGAVFRQRRAGRHGKPFTMLKFRTMRIDSEPYGCSPQSQEDPRLTRVGRFLRESSMDELPQFANVLAGQMSLVGPRPLYERQAAQWNVRQRRRLEVKPGLSGYAQAFGRGSNTLEQKLELDVYYVEHESFLLDMKIIFRTLANLLAGRGEVYEKRYSEAHQRESDHREPKHHS